MIDVLIIAGVVCLVITGLLSGAFTTGYQQRGNFYADSKDDRNQKKKAANLFFITGLVILVIAGVLFLLR